MGYTLEEMSRLDSVGVGGKFSVRDGFEGACHRTHKRDRPEGLLAQGLSSAGSLEVRRPVAT